MDPEKYCPKCFKKYPPAQKSCPADGSHLVSLSDRNLTGEVLDERYTILEQIGKGGMGVVYRAEQHLIKRIVALKVLRRDVVRDETSVKRFLNEARATASLESPHTVTLLDFGVTRDGLLYYTMELMKGQPLSRLIKTESPLEYKRAARLMMQVCDSLEEAHENNILHRDIKPDNIFVTVKRGKESVRVLDFGIAKIVGDTAMDTMTRTGMIIGTPQYLSPEQALGNPAVPSSDLYSLAIVFYEMLAGSPPFQENTPMKTMLKHLHEKPMPLQDKNPAVAVPKSLDVFLQLALEKEPGDRFKSARVFRKALEKALSDHDATPETVTVSALASTANGVRVITADDEAVVLEDPKKEPPREETAAAKPPDPGINRTVAFEPTPVRSVAEPKPQPQEQGDAAPEPDADSPALAPTAIAPSESLEAAIEPEPVPAVSDTVDSKEVSLKGVPLDTPATGPESETRMVLTGIARPKIPMPAIAGTVAAVLIIAVLAIWQPWAGTEGETPEPEGQKMAATVVPGEDAGRTAGTVGNRPDILEPQDSRLGDAAPAVALVVPKRVPDAFSGSAPEVVPVSDVSTQDAAVAVGAEAPVPTKDAGTVTERQPVEPENAVAAGEGENAGGAAAVDEPPPPVAAVGEKKKRKEREAARAARRAEKEKTHIAEEEKQRQKLAELERRVKEADWHVVQGTMSMQRGKYKDALGHFEKATDLTGSTDKLRSLIGQCKKKIAEKKKAEKPPKEDGDFSEFEDEDFSDFE